MGHHVLPAIWSYFTIERFDWSPKEIGYSLGFIGILMVFVQGYLIRVVLPKAGMRMAAVMGMLFTITAFAGYAAATTPWMMYVAMVPGALGALVGPAIQGIATSQIDASGQGELQGGLSSTMSLTAIISPVLMTQTFGYFTSAATPVYFPGASFVLAGLLTLLSLVLFLRVTAQLKLPTGEPA